jgi:hypothetical protein
MTGRAVTKPLPFTKASITRRILGIKQAGLHPLGVTADGTVLIGDRPLDTTSLVPPEAQTSPPSVRRFGEKLNGGQGAA